MSCRQQGDRAKRKLPEPGAAAMDVHEAVERNMAVICDPHAKATAVCTATRNIMVIHLHEIVEQRRAKVAECHCVRCKAAREEETNEEAAAETVACTRDQAEQLLEKEYAELLAAAVDAGHSEQTPTEQTDRAGQHATDELANENLQPLPATDPPPTDPPPHSDRATQIYHELQTIAEHWNYERDGIPDLRTKRGIARAREIMRYPTLSDEEFDLINVVGPSPHLTDPFLLALVERIEQEHREIHELLIGPGCSIDLESKAGIIAAREQTGYPPLSYADFIHIGARGALEDLPPKPGHKTAARRSTADDNPWGEPLPELPETEAMPDDPMLDLLVALADGDEKALASVPLPAYDRTVYRGQGLKSKFILAGLRMRRVNRLCGHNPGDWVCIAPDGTGDPTKPPPTKHPGEPSDPIPEEPPAKPTAKSPIGPQPPSPPDTAGNQRVEPLPLPLSTHPTADVPAWEER